MLIGIVGETLGIGKSTLLCFIGYAKQQDGYDIYANSHYKFPHTYINDASQVDSIRFGVLLGDDFWSWLDARCSTTLKNKYVSKVMLKSRKRGFDCYYTTQHEMLIDWRIQAITDIYMNPLFVNENCEIVTSYTRHGQLINKFKFVPKEVWDLFDTREEPDDLKDTTDSLKPIINKILKGDEFNGLTTKSSRIAYLKRNYNLGREDAHLVIDLVFTKFKKQYLKDIKRDEPIKPRKTKQKLSKIPKMSLSDIESVDDRIGLSLKK